MTRAKSEQVKPKPKPLTVMVCGFHRSTEVWEGGLVWRGEASKGERRELWTFNPLGLKRYESDENPATPDRHFELHPMWVHRKKGRHKYVRWIEERVLGVSRPFIYTQDGHEDAYGSIIFPIESPEMLALPRGGKYHAGTVDMMVAFALTLPTEDALERIIIRGMNYDTGGEPYSARACLEYWCGVAEGMGVKVDTDIQGVDREPRILSNTARFGEGVNDIDFRNPIYGYDVCHMGSLGEQYNFSRQRCPLWRPPLEAEAASRGYRMAMRDLEERVDL